MRRAVLCLATLCSITTRAAYGQSAAAAPRTIPDWSGAWVMQGPISDRENEHLSLSDKGVILYHRMLHEEMDKAARGEDPLGTIRDPAENEPMIDLRRERKALQAFQSKYATTFDRVTRAVENAAE